VFKFNIRRRLTIGGIRVAPKILTIYNHSIYNWRDVDLSLSEALTFEFLRERNGLASKLL
ncbi:MAG: hypothetical protein KAI93_10750, partial [Desulfobacterales bacterium]|nr:hypothetical protein [Desulfobacterales bacterium]